MTDAEARVLEERWGNPYPSPGEGWVWCAWCGEPWPDEVRFWAVRAGRRICHACHRDHQTGHGKPHSAAWHRKNRWTPAGQLLRRCSRCGTWKEIRLFHARIIRGEVQAHTWCRRCVNHPPKKYIRRIVRKRRENRQAQEAKS